MAKVAFIGLGVMGYPMAGHLKARGGHDVTVYNRTAAKAEQWAAAFGGRTAATPAEAAKGQDFVFACVGNDDDLRSVTLGPDGAFDAMKKGAIFIDNTTASAEVARELDALAPEGVEAGQRERHVVRAGRQVDDQILPRTVSHDHPDFLDEHRTGSFHRHPGQHGAGGIGHDARNRALRGSE